MEFKAGDVVRVVDTEGFPPKAAKFYKSGIFVVKSFTKGTQGCWLTNGAYVSSYRLQKVVTFTPDKEYEDLYM